MPHIYTSNQHSAAQARTRSLKRNALCSGSGRSAAATRLELTVVMPHDSLIMMR